MNFHRARDALRGFDQVIVTDWLDREAYCERVAARLELGEAGIAFPHLNATSRSRPYDVREHLTPALRERIRACNRWDLELYRVGCRQSADELGSA